MQTPLDYLGFCLWSIVKRDGLLLPGKPVLGVYRYYFFSFFEKLYIYIYIFIKKNFFLFRYKDKNCVFSDEKCINEFI
jgi:hypothetical protein